MRLPSICVLSHREGLRTELRPRVCSQLLETATRKPPDERGLKSQLHANPRRAAQARKRNSADRHPRAAQPTSAARKRNSDRAAQKRARDAVNVDETQEGVDRLQDRVHAGF